MSGSVISPARVTESARFIRSRIKMRPSIALILGSGLGPLAGKLKERTVLSVGTVPHYPDSTVEGHRGNLVAGTLRGIPLLVLQGRTHYYETGNLEATLFPVRVMHELGITTLIITNAAGGVNAAFSAGDLMMITDQINFTFEHQTTRSRAFPERPGLYDERLQLAFLTTAARNRLILRTGVYCGVKGPSYETAAEIAMIRRCGGDAVGMSTVNEVSLAHALGMRVAGISCITNLATGMLDEKLSHADVTTVARSVQRRFAMLLSRVVPEIAPL